MGCVSQEREPPESVALGYDRFAFQATEDIVRLKDSIGHANGVAGYQRRASPVRGTPPWSWRPPRVGALFRAPGIATMPVANEPEGVGCGGRFD